MVREEFVSKCTEVFSSIGFCKNDAFEISEYLAEVERKGETSHGISFASRIINRTLNGGYNLSASSDAIIWEDNESFLKADANNIVGVLSAKRCMEKAIIGAKKKGVYFVFSKNSNTFGSAFYYAEMAKSKKCIGIVMSNTPPAMVPFNGAERLLGTNPLSIAIPGCKDNGMVLDMASSVVAKSKICNMYNTGIFDIPNGWAVDKYGNATNDAKAAMDGSLIPFGGAKGYGIALAIDLISGLLSGAEYSINVRNFDNAEKKSMNVGQLFVCINPELIYGKNYFEKVDEYLNILRNSKVALGYESVMIPGDKKYEHAINFDYVFPAEFFKYIG